MSRLFIAAALVLLLCACDSKSRQSDSLTEELPTNTGLNVLIVSFDAMRADALGLYGYSRPTSVNLDRFAQESLIFDHAYAAAPVTPTSFAAAFTGQLPFRVFNAWKLIETDTLAEIFAGAGFTTFALLNNTQLVAERNFQQGWQRYDVVHLPDRELLQQAMQRIEEVGDQRFLGWVHFISPHTPYDYREMAEQFYDPDYSGRFEQTVPGTFEVQNEKELKRVRDLYDGEVFFADVLFGELLEFLDERGLMDNTLIVVTSDHGEEFMDHGNVQHNSQFEELIRIPMLIRHPDRPVQTRTDAPYLNTDLLPTLAAIVGIDAPEVPDGLDLTRNFRRDRLRLSVGMTHKELRQVSATRKKGKLIVTCRPEYSESLYDLASDPGEQVDLILDAPKVADELYEGMTRQSYGEACELVQLAVSGQAETHGLTDEQINELKSLGYLQ